MATKAHTNGKVRLYREVLRRLADLGYSGDLLKEEYEFSDYFSSEVPSQIAPAAAFGQTPTGYDSACIAVLIGNGKVGHNLIRDYRALGAPLAFEIEEHEIGIWKVSTEPSEQDKQGTIPADRIETVFQENEDQWAREKIFRSKNIGAIESYQLDFIDRGLIPALEEQVRPKLDHLLRFVLREAERDFKERRRRKPEWGSLWRLLFRAVYGKILRDRGELKPELCVGTPAARALLSEVSKTYGDAQPVLDDPITQDLVVRLLWEGISFKNLSVEVLAFIWENFLVSPEARKAQSIYRTPHNIARYIVHRLPIGEIPQDERRIVEPCCGSGTFLVSGMQRLRELLPPGTPATQRHAHFVKMLSGFDIEDAGLEVARPCLMLADFPNPDGWELQHEDVFNTPEQSPLFFQALREARVILCNPPFKKFTPRERQRYSSINSPLKPAELLARVLENLHAKGVFGFVLPASAIDGQSYVAIRGQLAEKFSELEVVFLPEKTFEKANFPTILLIAKRPSIGHSEVRVTFSRVTDRDEFLKTGLVERSETEAKSSESVKKSLAVADLQELWAYLANYNRLIDFAPTIQRGVEWHDFKKNADRYISPVSKRGFVPGFHTADRMFCFEQPPLMYLWEKKETKKYRSWDLPWNLPKVVCNAVRKSQGPWKITACPVNINALSSQNFIVI